MRTCHCQRYGFLSLAFYIVRATIGKYLEYCKYLYMFKYVSFCRTDSPEKKTNSDMMNWGKITMC